MAFCHTVSRWCKTQLITIHKRWSVFAGCSILLLGVTARAEIVLLPKGENTVWRYHYDRSAPAATWTHPDFDDSKWHEGKAPLGYGEPELGSRISFGQNPEEKPITGYFRTTFKTSPNQKERLEKLSFSLRQDDGAVVYVNAKEVGRINMPPGPVRSTTFAVSALGGHDETIFRQFVVPASVLSKEGADTVAVEVHQAYPSSSDLYLDLEIKGYLPNEGPKQDLFRAGWAAVERGDYEEAAELLSKLEPEHPHYATTMAVLAYQIYGQALGRASEGLPYAKKAYEIAPNDRYVVRAYIKTHVLSGALFDDDDIARQRKTMIADDHAFLVTNPEFGDTSERFARRQLEQDLDYLEHVLANCFAYLELRDVDYRGALDAIRISLDDEMPVNSFELCVAKLISLFCDGHATMHHHPSVFLPRGYAPYLAGMYDGRVYLFKTDASGLLDADHPYVTHIDGKSIGEWLEVAGYIAVKESEQWHRRQALENLSYVTYIRSELGLALKETLTLRLESNDHSQSKELVVKLQAHLAVRPQFPRGASRRIEGVGYLRIPHMTSNPRALTQLERWMEKFRDTRGLIIDVRGNNGGTKDVLFILFPYFLKPGAKMHVVEFSTYRMPMELPKPNPIGFMMSDMSAQTLGSSRWKNDAKRQQVRQFIRHFRPEWELPLEKFSEWHVLALDAGTNPLAYYYDKPLIILQDSGTFSAGDIFLGAFEDHERATLMGTPSGGGNGWMESYVLPNTRLGLVL